MIKLECLKLGVCKRKTKCEKCNHLGIMVAHHKTGAEEKFYQCKIYGRTITENELKRKTP